MALTKAEKKEIKQLNDTIAAILMAKGVLQQELQEARKRNDRANSLRLEGELHNLHRKVISYEADKDLIRENRAIQDRIVQIESLKQSGMTGFYAHRQTSKRVKLIENGNIVRPDGMTVKEYNRKAACVDLKGANAVKSL